MKLAIVGTSHLSEREEMDARKLIALLIKDRQPKLIISGGAKGVDTIAKEVADSMRVNTSIFYPCVEDWEYYKTRNLLIAEFCDEIVCITTPTKTKKCYHCKADHQKTGGCYTAYHALKLGKVGRIFLV